jgi:putative ABC transport system substrate-binding protein
MRRREFIAALGGAAAWPVAGWAQSPPKIARIGFLGLGPPSAWTNQIEAFRAGLKDLGLIEGKNVVIDFRWAEQVDQLPALATALVKTHVETSSWRPPRQKLSLPTKPRKRSQSCLHNMPIR